jgi:hypothetical protein
MFAISLAIVQLFHLIVFTDAESGVYLTWFLVTVVINSSLWILGKSAAHGEYFVHIPWRPLVGILFISFVFKLTSRVEYITATLSYGLNAARTDPNVGAGGLASFVNIFFYPAAILLAFTILPKRVYRVCLVLISIICMVDMLFIGTRNAPVFVLLFILLATPFKFSIKTYFQALIALVSFIAIFSYSTTNRGADADSFDWQVAFELTGSTQVLHINKDIAATIGDNAPALFPAVFLLHYVTHSIAELENMMMTRDWQTPGGLYYMTDQFCAVGFCSRQDSQDRIDMVNPRSNVYQTIFSTLFYDFGIVLSCFIWVILLLFLCLRQRVIMRKEVGIDIVFFSILIMVGSIENYLYNGLNFVQILVIFLLQFMFWFYQNVLIRACAAPSSHIV